MNNFVNKMLLVSIFSTYAILSGLSAMAADTEIFFRPPPPNAPKPNVLFIMSTGGTMNGGVTPPAGCADASKIGALKCILKDIIDIEDRINIGLMRYSGPGGPVLYPISNLDGAVVIAPPVETYIATGSHDITQNAPLDHEDSSTTLVIGESGKLVGFHFNTVDIPRGATITKAELHLTAAVDSSANGKFNIYVEQSNNATEFNLTGPEDLYSRTLGTAVNWSLTGGEAWTTPNSYLSADFTSEINAIVSDSDNYGAWCGGNSINIYIDEDTSSSGGTRTINSFEGVNAPKLHLEWDDTNANAIGGCISSTVGATIDNVIDDAEDVRKNASTVQLGTNATNLDFAVSTGSGAAARPTEAIGLLFKDVNIPRGATISEAFIEMDGAEGNALPFNITIGAIQNPIFTTWANGFSTIAQGTNTVTWNQASDAIVNGNSGNWITDSIRTPNINTVIQQLVGLATWTDNGVANNIPITLKVPSPPSAMTRRVSSKDNSGTIKLQVTYSGSYTSAYSLSVRTAMKDAVDDYKLVSNQPTTETYLEGYKYYTGKEVVFGKYRGQPTRTTNRVSHPTSYTNGALNYTGSATFDTCKGNPESTDCDTETIADDSGSPTYIKPPMSQCQSNHIVLLSDGAPSPLDSGTSATTLATFNADPINASCSDNDGEDCAVALSNYLANNDQDTSIPEDQLIISHGIHFGAENVNKERFPRAIADASPEGMYLSAADGPALKVAFETLISSLAKTNSSFVSAGITVNQSNRLTHKDQLYFSLFRPEPFKSWPGNVKRYRIYGGEIVDANDLTAIESGKDIFLETSESYWSGFADGNDAGLGGTASQLDFTVSSPRKTFSNLTGNTDISFTSNSGANQVNTSNYTESDATDPWHTLLGTTGADTTETLQWVKGFKANGDLHHNVGDPLHSKPTILTYRHDLGSGTELTDMVFAGTNHGFLHGFLTETGAEKWSFIPKDLLPRVYDYVENLEQAPAAHQYGVDGSIEIYVDDKNGDGAVDVDLNEKAYLFVGLRRGGSAYYAFDITDYDDPELMYVINRTTSGDFDELGETWSKPTVAKMADANETDGYKLVMIFGGGYDSNQDTAAVAPSNDSSGRTIYIVDALTGAKIWDARSGALDAQYTAAGSITAMNSIPGDVKLVQIKHPTYFDHLYAADTKGQVFRFDFNLDYDSSVTGSKLVQGGMLAQIQTDSDGFDCSAANESSGDIADALSCNRRFYYSPDIAFIQRPKGLSYISVALGSGYRAHPLTLENDDAFYGIRDYGVLNFELDNSNNRTGFSIFDNHDGTTGTSSGDELIELSNLIDLVNLTGDSATGTTAVDAIEDADDPTAGWYLSLNEGEKVLARSITFNNRVIFTTYIPPDSTVSACSPAQGEGRAYSISVVDGTPATDSNNDGIIDSRYIDLHNIGIPPSPQVIILDPGAELLIGRQIKTNQLLGDGEVGEMVEMQKWRERTKR